MTGSVEKAFQHEQQPWCGCAYFRGQGIQLVLRYEQGQKNRFVGELRPRLPLEEPSSTVFPHTCICIYIYVCINDHEYIYMYLYIYIYAPPLKTYLMHGDTIFKIRNTFIKNQQLKNRELETPSPRINNSRTENDSGNNHIFLP